MCSVRIDGFFNRSLIGMINSASDTTLAVSKYDAKIVITQRLKPKRKTEIEKLLF